MLKYFAGKILVLKVVIVLSLLLLGCTSPVALLEPPRAAPLARVTLWDGEYASIDKWHGRTVVLAFWASWCRYSRKRIPLLAEVARDYRDNKKVVFIAVSLDRYDRRGVVEKLISSPEFTGPLYGFSGNDLGDEAYLVFDPPQLPYFYILDGNRQVVAQGGSSGSIAGVLKELGVEAPVPLE